MTTAKDLALDNRVIAYHAEFSKMLGSIQAGLFLSQLLYWQGKGSDPKGWIYKTQDEWYEETGLKRKAQETARRILKEAGIIKEKLKGIPAKLHFWLNIERLNECLTEFRHRVAEGRKPTKLVCLDSTNKSAQSGHTITETTAQITFVVVEDETKKIENEQKVSDIQVDKLSLHKPEMATPPAPEESSPTQVQHIIDCIKDATDYVADYTFVAGLLSQWNFEYVYRKIDRVTRYSRINESVTGFIIRACQRNYPEPRKKVKSKATSKARRPQRAETGNSYHTEVDAKKKALIRSLYCN